MSGVPYTQPITHDEGLARFILFSGWYRSNGTIKEDAFIPAQKAPPFTVSVTRKTGLQEKEIWKLGNDIVIGMHAKQKPATLYGRADVSASAVLSIADPCSVKLDPTKPPPANHINITDWPADKAARKIIAAQIAAAASFITAPAH